MNDLSRNKEALMRLAPSEIEAYLRGTGWVLFDTRPGKTSCWERPEQRRNEDVAAICVLDRSLRDYAERTSELLELVARVERRSAGDVYTSVRDVGYDIAELQIEREDARDGTIPLKDGVKAFDGALRLYAAAAAAVDERRPYFGRLLKGKVSRFVSKNARLGQTRIGSYVITIATRVADAQEELPFPAPLEPLERQVMLRMATALSVARQAAIVNTAQAFFDGVTHGVSANLCDAVADMAEGGAAVKVNVALQWSLVQPVEKSVPRLLSFGPELVRNLREGSAHLRFQEPLMNFQLIGKVVRLERWPEEPDGTVGIDGFVDSETELVSVTLTKGDYATATAAHDQGAAVVCVGELKKTGRGFVLWGAHSFTVVGSGPSTLNRRVKSEEPV
ncbi:hypothetical protein [Myxococcus sp. CA039A]|uniref:hypothetical protein n=1 Tax=Myxococcus sp. CA039A TaxID=2741737 RepID=UPI00157ADD66|nr:hypothetical protein [Myxococcus sp. CA039A]NTX50408.1 hypothetical protein [Myxococcus sp. CA039A]